MFPKLLLSPRAGIRDIVINIDEKPAITRSIPQINLGVAINIPIGPAMGEMSNKRLTDIVATVKLMKDQNAAPKPNRSLPRVQRKKFPKLVFGLTGIDVRYAMIGLIISAIS